MSNYYYNARGEMAGLDGGKVDGGDHPSGKVSKYTVKIDYGNDGEFYGRIDHFAGRSWNFWALSLHELKRQISLCVPNFRFQYTLSRAAELAENPAAAAMLGPGR
jgi:hypothetical protein